MTATVVTHGCRMNLAQADALAALAGPGVTVVNSCAVTSEAVRDARTAAKRALAGGGRVVVTGCAVEAEPERFAGLGVGLVGNRGKLRAESWGRADAPSVGSADTSPVNWGGPDAFFPRSRGRGTAEGGGGGSPPPFTGEGDHAKHGGGGRAWHPALAASLRTRGFVAVQDGCDHRCTFCVIAPARGPARSATAAEVVAAARDLVARGANEVVLTGVDATSWGQDLPGQPVLGALVQALLAGVPELKRLRLSSLDAAEADDALLEALSDSRVMPHVHLSLQHGDDLILKRMRRRHSRRDALRVIERLRRARQDMALGADLIAGFPTEGAAAHAASLTLLDEAGIVHAHVFPYSPRPGTPAARMPQLDTAIIRARAAELRVAAAERHAAWLQGWVGKPLEVLAEGAHGWSPHYARVVVPAGTPRGVIITVTPAAACDGALV